MSQEWLEAEYLKAVTAHAAGSSITGTSAGDVSVQKQPDFKTDSRVRNILKALCKLDPVKWKPEDCLPITQTRVAFRGSCNTLWP
jgi:hypothetical protein